MRRLADIRDLHRTSKIRVYDKGRRHALTLQQVERAFVHLFP
jgi:hypothetical protein